MNEQWMTVKEVAVYLKLSPDMIYRLAQQGRIPVSRVGSRWRFKKEKIDQWMEEQASASSHAGQRWRTRR